MYSSRFNDLSGRISELRNNLLPKEEDFEPTGLYDDDIYDHTRAFRVLAHAEFESFIEDRVVDVANTAYEAWVNYNQISPCLLALLAYNETGYGEPTSLLQPPQKKAPDLASRVSSARSSLTSYARNKNHGIREKNLLRMLLPLGILEAEIDTEWLAATDAWARQRGATAHTSGKARVQPNPERELKTVREVLDGFGDIDIALSGK